ncbi:LysR family transcriptional regulator [Variovorax ginsengisoli]|uniref:LysR family glycine cleavage system transcriptional activator n=1 Tax=Variovorax ginsengisoli TaxID=363844 RepID=A0ABT9SE67_9BURK|nr:LysR family transcriptional regulator [Variovorax ginsengisoli]MDP9901657.1 LysR family glycine cleavage system transcriptional activator [Variovorax ginsengisoli]
MFTRKFLPSMGQLMAFESAARHASISRAADELNLTQSAISRQIKQFEAQIGTALFHRVRQRVVLTDAGRAYAAALRTGLQTLSDATQHVMTMGAMGKVLNLAVLPTFGTQWLIPRVRRFVALQPDVTVNFASRTEPFDFVREPFDAAIHFGTDFWPGASCHYLLSESVVPVCSPEFRRRQSLHTREDLAQQVLLHQSSRPVQWAEWFQQEKVSAPHAMQGPRFEHFAMLAQAAANGLGVALVPRFLIEEELASERLVVLFGQALATERAYYVVVPDTGAENPLVIAFRDWLIGEAAATWPPTAMPSRPPASSAAR